MKTLRIRIHHIDSLIKALVSKTFREGRYLKVRGKGAKGGFCYSGEEARSTRDLLDLFTDDTRIKIVQGMDALCALCTSKERWDKTCKKLDPVWELWDLFSPLEAAVGAIISVKVLKERYRLGRKYGSLENWRKETTKNRKKKEERR